MKVAIVHDWLVELGGAEKVFTAIAELYPSADIFSLVCFLSEKELPCLAERNITTSFIQKLPFAAKKYRSYFALMPLAIEQLDFSEYDLIISSSYCVAKGIITGPDQIHISYCHSPMRYAWDLQNQYLRDSNLSKGIKSILTRYLLHKMRIWDVRSSFGVDYFIANSEFIGRRIQKTYRRSSKVIYPNIDVDKFDVVEEKQNFYITWSRLVPYKKIDLIVEAFSKMPDKKLIVIGDGPDRAKIEALSTSNIELMGYQPFSTLKTLVQNAKAVIFAAEEDFGMVPLESQAAGTPVLAYGKGGAKETIIDGETGLFFYEQSTDAIQDVVNRFEQSRHNFSPFNCRKNAEMFSDSKFKTNFSCYVEKCISEYLPAIKS